MIVARGLGRNDTQQISIAAFGFGLSIIEAEDTSVGGGGTPRLARRNHYESEQYNEFIEQQNAMIIKLVTQAVTTGILE